MAVTTGLDTNGDTCQEHDEPFRLLDLPPGMWVNIGQMAVDEAAQSIRDHGKKLKSQGEFGSWPWIIRAAAEQNKRLVQPDITKVCRILRKELLPYHCESNVPLAVFGCETNWLLDNINRWLSAIGSESRIKLQWANLILHEDSIGQNDGAEFKDRGKARAFYFEDNIAVELGSPVAISDTPEEFQKHFEFLDVPCCGQNCFWKITFK